MRLRKQTLIQVSDSCADNTSTGRYAYVAKRRTGDRFAGGMSRLSQEPLGIFQGELEDLAGERVPRIAYYHGSLT